MNEFEQIYKENAKKVYGYLLSLCRNEFLAQELTSETFCKAIIKIDSFRGDCDISVWLCQIAKHLYYSYCRKEKKRDNSFPESENDFVLTIDDKEQTKEIMLHLHSLDDPYKEVFMLHVFAEIELKEISKLFDKSESWARVTFYRAKEQIIRKLREGNKNE